jgi:hypothetical protein
MGMAALIAWVLTICLGAYMLATLIARGGLRPPDASRDHLPPGVLVGHFSLAVTGLVVWISYLATGWGWLAWSAVGLLMPAIGLGISTVTLWTPYPGRTGAAGQGGFTDTEGAGPAERAPASQLPDDVLARALADEVLASKLMDDLLAGLLADPAGAATRPSRHLRALIPACHGVAATATFLLAALTAAGMR